MPLLGLLSEPKRIEPQRVLDYDGNDSVFDDMNNVDQSNILVLVDKEDEDDAYMSS